MNQLYDATVDSTPLPRFIEVRDANRKAFRAFCRGCVFGAILATGAFIGSAAFGETITIGGTGCQLIPVSGQGHVAEVRCRNIPTGGYQSDVGASLTAGGISVRLWIEQEPGEVPDAFTVTPSDGYIADPQTLVLDERTTGVILILPFLGS